MGYWKEKYSETGIDDYMPPVIVEITSSLCPESYLNVNDEKCYRAMGAWFGRVYSEFCILTIILFTIFYTQRKFCFTSTDDWIQHVDIKEDDKWGQFMQDKLVFMLVICIVWGFMSPVLLLMTIL